MMKVSQDRVKKMLIDTVSLLCKNSLHYEVDISIEGLLGIKVDKKDVFFVHISENIAKDLHGGHDQTVELVDGAPGKKKRRKASGQAAARRHALQVETQKVVEILKQDAPDVTTVECTDLDAHNVKLETVAQVADLVQRRAIRAKPLESAHEQLTTADPTVTTMFDTTTTQHATFVQAQAQPQQFEQHPGDQTDPEQPTTSCTTTTDGWPHITTVACGETITVQAAQAAFQATAGQLQTTETIQTSCQVWPLPPGVVVQTEADTETTLTQPTVQTTTITTDVAGQQFALPKYKWTMLGHRSQDAAQVATQVATQVRLPQQQVQVQQQVQHVQQQQTQEVQQQVQQQVQQVQQQQQQQQQVQQQVQQQQVQQQVVVSQAPATVVAQAQAPAQPVAGGTQPASQRFTKTRECALCGKTFLLDSSLKRHLRAHAGKKPYKCELCEAAFIQSSDLKKHFRSHTGEKPYSCSICGMAFSQVGDRNRHQARHNRLVKA